MKPETTRAEFRLSMSPEKLALALLVGQSFALGFAFALLYTAANALFLVHFGSQFVPFAFIAIAIVVPSFSFVFTQAQRRLSFPGLALITVLLFTALFFLAWAGLKFGSARWLAFALLVGYTLGGLICGIVRNVQAGFIFDARRLKQVFPYIVGGEIGGVIVGGVSTVFLATAMGSAENTLLVAGASMAVFLVLVAVTTRVFHAAIAGGGKEGLREREKPRLGRLLRKKYIVLLLVYQIMSSMGTRIVYYLFLNQAETIYTTPESLTEFFGIVMAGATAVTLLFVIFLSGKLLTRFGMGFGLAGNPVGVAIGVIGAAAVGTFWGSRSPAFFWFILAAGLFDVILTSGLTDTSVQSSYQPLSPAERTFVQTLVEGVGIPLAYGLSGASLLLFTQVRGMTTTHALYFTLGLTAAWTVSSLALYRQYGRQLELSIKRRRVEGADISLADRSSLAVVERLLESPRAEEATFALALLESSGHPSLAARLERALGHPDPQVRTAALAAIERLKPPEAQDSVRRLLSGESDPSVRPKAVLALCALASDEPDETAVYLKDPEREVSDAAIVGLFRYCGAGGAVAAASVFGGLCASSDEGAKLRLARILGEIGARTLYAPLLPLLVDPSDAVRREAVLASGRIGHPRLWPFVIACLGEAATRSAAMTALSFSGDEAIAVLKGHFETKGREKGEGYGNKTLVRLIRVCSSSRSPKVVAFFSDYIDHPDLELRIEILKSLSLCGYTATGEERGRVEASLAAQAAIAFRILSSLEEIRKTRADGGEEGRGRGSAISLLEDALEDELSSCRRRIFLLLSFLYDRETVAGAERKFGSGIPAQRALAIELLDVTLSRPLKRLVLPILDLARSAGEGCLSEILSSSESWPSDWIRTCALYAVATNELAAASLGRRETPMALTPDASLVIEKVIVLKAAEVFASIPDHVLAFIASIVEELEISRGETFIRKGEIANCMYLIVEGKVLVHDGESRIAELGRGQTVGELAVLDPEPRSASVTALGDTRLFRIEKEAFDEVMADQPEISQGVIQVLCRRLRTRIAAAGI